MSKVKPYCPRTLRHAARLLSLQAHRFFHHAKPNVDAADVLDTWAEEFLGEARAIERKAKP